MEKPPVSPASLLLRVTFAHRYTNDVLNRLSDLCYVLGSIEIEGWSDAPSDKQIERLNDRKVALSQALNELNQVLLPLKPFVDQLGLKVFKEVYDLGTTVENQLADPINQWQSARDCAEKLGVVELTELQVQADLTAQRVTREVVPPLS